MKRLVTTEEMRSMDREAIEGRRIPGYDLMRAAGAGVADAVLDHFPDVEDARVVILAGRGNNGGDGFVVARYLKQSDLRPVVILVAARPGDLTGDALQAYRDWDSAKGETLVADTEDAWTSARKEILDADLVVDALLGTGARGAPRGLVGTVIEDLEGLSIPVVSVDIPSGLDADTGHVEGSCIAADLTVTMALPKRGQFLFPGRSFVGELEVVDIGIPPDVMDSGSGPRAYVVEEEDVIERLPEREPEMHKGDRGRLLVVGGSAGLTGAVALAAEAAVRAGAGLVTAGIPLSLNDILEAKLTEVMTLPLPELEVRALSREAFDSIALFQPGRLTALAVGGGAGRHPSTRALIRRVIQEIQLPTVLDADGIYAFEGEADLLRMAAPGGRLVLTPHPGEFAALTGEKMDDVVEDPFAAASRWARRLGTVIVLKGAPTVIADPGSETVYLNSTGSEALATGGTGDVLTGIIAGFLAQGMEPLDAALAGVYLHGYTADTIVSDWGSLYGLKAGDLIDWFPVAVGDLVNPIEE